MAKKLPFCFRFVHTLVIVLKTYPKNFLLLISIDFYFGTPQLTMNGQLIPRHFIQRCLNHFKLSRLCRMSTFGLTNHSASIDQVGVTFIFVIFLNFSICLKFKNYYWLRLHWDQVSSSRLQFKWCRTKTRGRKLLSFSSLYSLTPVILYISYLQEQTTCKFL